MEKHYYIFAIGLVVGVVCAYILAFRRAQKLGNTLSNLRDDHTVGVDIAPRWNYFPSVSYGATRDYTGTLGTWSMSRLDFS